MGSREWRWDRDVSKTIRAVFVTCNVEVCIPDHPKECLYSHGTGFSSADVARKQVSAWTMERSPKDDRLGHYQSLT